MHCRLAHYAICRRYTVSNEYHFSHKRLRLQVMVWKWNATTIFDHHFFKIRMNLMIENFGSRWKNLVIIMTENTTHQLLPYTPVVHLIRFIRTHITIMLQEVSQTEFRKIKHSRSFVCVKHIDDIQIQVLLQPNYITACSV